MAGGSPAVILATPLSAASSARATAAAVKTTRVVGKVATSAAGSGTGGLVTPTAVETVNEASGSGGEWRCM